MTHNLTRIQAKHLVLYCAFFLPVLLGCSTLSGVNENHRDLAQPRNIILLIGDGMGVSQVTAGKIGKGTLRLEEFSTMGLLMTHALDVAITDSAAAATALATGQKTYDGSIAMSAGRKPLKTVGEYAADTGKSLGLVTTHSVTDATPAAFFAHVENRNQQEEIAEQIAKRNLDVVFGGGWGYFIPDSLENGLRTDNKDLRSDLSLHRTLVRTTEEFQKLTGKEKVAALLAPKHLPPPHQRGVSLSMMTQMAIRILSRNPKGFFLLVEAAQIDGGGHINNVDLITAEFMDFDDAVGAAVDFAREDGETLIIVTADHETGGFAIHNASIQGKEIVEVGFTTNRHTAAMVPLFAFGPGSRVFGGIRDNTYVGLTLIRYLSESSD